MKGDTNFESSFAISGLPDSNKASSEEAALDCQSASDEWKRG